MDNEVVRTDGAANFHLAKHAAASVFDKLAALRVDVERLHRETSGLVRHIAQRENSPDNQDLVWQLESAVSNLEETIDLLEPEPRHADSCPAQRMPAAFD